MSNKALSLIKDVAPTLQAFDHLLILSGPRVTEYTNLISENALPVIINELEALCAPTSPERATYWGKVLVGSYPNIKVDDPKTYALALSSVFAEAPDDICRRAVDEITRTQKFPPTRAVVNERLEQLKKERLGKIAIANAMQREHERRREEIQEKKKRAKAREEWRKKHGDKTPLEVYYFNKKASQK